MTARERRTDLMLPKRTRLKVSLVSLMPVGANPMPPPVNPAGGVVVMVPGGVVVMVPGGVGVVEVTELGLEG